MAENCVLWLGRLVVEHLKILLPAVVGNEAHVVVVAPPKVVKDDPELVVRLNTVLVLLSRLFRRRHRVARRAFEERGSLARINFDGLVARVELQEAAAKGPDVGGLVVLLLKEAHLWSAVPPCGHMW